MTRPLDKPPSRFGRFKREAEEIIESPERVQSLVGQAVQKLQSAGGDRFREMREQLDDENRAYRSLRELRLTGPGAPTIQQ